jgi:regulator of sigma E protease
VLVVVHELGHFSVAKFFGIRVDEFGLGYPPKAKKLFSWKGTEFTLNWLPFGGFVKIFGENPDEDQDELKEASIAQDSFQSKNRGIQASVLVAGVVFNFIFAWLLISLGFMTGLPAPAGSSFVTENPHTVITTVIPGSPAHEAGLRSGDEIVSLERDTSLDNITPESASSFISESNLPITFNITRGSKELSVSVTPKEGIIADKPAIGISMDTIGTVTLPPHKALWYGLKSSIELTILTAKALGAFISKAVIGKADLTQVTGPVGLVSMVGNIRELGFAYIISFTALISINLSIVNLLPFPALDGGRLVFVGLEAIRRKPISPRVFNTVNTIGFALLIFLMILVTFRDVQNIL